MTSFNNGLKVNVIKGASAEAITSATISCLSSKSIATEKATEASVSASSASMQASIATAQAVISTTKASEASVSASSAEASASTASLKANEASNSASSALTSKMDAATSEENALSYKNSASVSAATATNKASEASDSVDIALAYQYGAESAYNSTLSLVNNLVLPSVTHTVDTVDDFGTIPNGIYTVIVKDINRGGTFIYDATQSAVNNGGTIFDGWVRQYSGAVNVKWFGASYNTAISMQSLDIPNGLVISTFGYYSEGDGGGGDYIVSSVVNTNYYVNPTLLNGNCAYFIGNEIRASQAGCLSSDTSCVVNYQQMVSHLGELGGGTIITDGNYIFDGTYSRFTDGVNLESNIMFLGLSGSSLTGTIDCTYFFKDGFREVATDVNNLTNISFKNMTFKTPSKYDFVARSQFNSVLALGTGNNYTIEDCKFYGWAGDAITLGNIYLLTDAWAVGIVRDCYINNNYFDGVDKQNRQAISILACEDLTITNNIFKNTTRSDMPGCIDFEPELSGMTMKNVIVAHNTFDNIGGDVGVIALATAGKYWTKPPENFNIHDNIFNDCDNARTFYVSGYVDIAYPSVISAAVTKTITFKNNEINNCNTWIASAVSGLLISGNSFRNCIAQIQMGAKYVGATTYFVASDNVIIKDNEFEKCKVITNSDTYAALINVTGKHRNLQIKGNTFLDCGTFNTSDVIQSHVMVGIGQSANLSNFVVLKNNVHMAKVYFPSSATTIPYFTQLTLSSPHVWVVGDNVMMNLYNSPKILSLYAQCKVTDDGGIVYNKVVDPSTEGGWNGYGTFDATTLPDSIPFGLKIALDDGNIAEFANGKSIITSTKVTTTTSKRQYNYQIATCSSYPSRILKRHASSSGNVWGSWTIVSSV